MIQPAKASIAARLIQRLNLRFPALVLILGILTLVNLFIPDPIPFIDEIVLAILATLFGMWKKRSDPQ